MKPAILYVDDEPQNLVVFEAACPEDWALHVFDSPAKALESLDQIQPHVIVSDQRMPGMNGVQFLEIAKKIVPNSIRIIVTGYSDEDLVVQSVRKAQIFDYVKKPWDVDDLLASLRRALDLFDANTESRRLLDELRVRDKELSETNLSLLSALRDLELAKVKESKMRQELECWVPPFVLWTIRGQESSVEKNPDLIGIAMDIINSSRLHDVTFEGRPIRGQVIQIFTEAVLRHGGWRESHSGDSAYGHFGLLEERENTSESALAAAHEFRAGLKSLAEISGVQVECGISLHIARKCPIQLHSVHLNTPRGPITQKSFDTSSADIDLLHRMEKLVHQLPGSNIVMSKVFAESLRTIPVNALGIGSHLFVGQKDPVELLLIPSYYVKPPDLIKIRELATAPRPNAA
jgi:CheY-like chemotaxis protein